MITNDEMERFVDFALENAYKLNLEVMAEEPQVEKKQTIQYAD